jgi:RimJ/RimL family protein N-acetyltransferase
MNGPTWQPSLVGRALGTRPLTEADYEPLFAAASDPLIWELHPDRERYTRPGFEAYFRSGMESRGALAVLDLQSGKIVGSSRYSEPSSEGVEIGWTFLARAYWGGAHNRELKSLMLGHAFQFVPSVYFVVGSTNLRSLGAMRKIGGVDITGETVPLKRDLAGRVVFRIGRADWLARGGYLPGTGDSAPPQTAGPGLP